MYFSGDNIWLLNTRNNFFLIENLKLSALSIFGIKIQIVLNNGFHLQAENIELIKLDEKKICSLNEIL